MTKIRNGLIGLVLLVVGIVALARYIPPDSAHGKLTREDCVKQRIARGDRRTIQVRLSGTWGGTAPATISYSVTNQETVGPFDHTAPGWSDYVNARACDLILLHVTPTKGKGETTARINRADRVGAGYSSTNPNGGPAMIAHWFDSVD